MKTAWSLALRPESGFAVLVILTAAGCSRSSGTTYEKRSPAKVENAVAEDQLTTLTLTAKAVERLGVAIATVERRKVARVRTLGGEVVVRPGAAIAIEAPVAGTLLTTEVARVAGSEVARDEVLARLLPIFAPESKVQLATQLAARSAEAAGEAERAAAQLQAARVMLARAEQLLLDEAGSVRDVDDAKAATALAEASLNAAEGLHEAVRTAASELESGAVSPLPLRSPISGLLRRVHAGPGQQVAAGAPVFEVLDSKAVWVRMPVYVGDVQSLDVHSDVQVGSPSARPGEDTTPASPVAAPPTAQLASATVDLYYSLAGGDWRPGQRVGVSVPLLEPEESLVVPWAAVIHDVLGGTWVYEQTAERTFVRRRVEVRHVVAGDCVLANGPPPGTSVVTDGAAEIFGTEFGTGK